MLKTNRPKRILLLSLDVEAFEESSKIRNRLRVYGKDLEWCGVIIPTRKRRYSEDDVLSIYGTGGSNRLLRWLRMFWQASRLIQRQQVQVVSAQDMYYLGLLAVVLHKLYSVAVEVQVYGLDKFNFFRRELTDFTLRNVHSLRVAGEALKTKLIEQFGVPEDRIHIVPTHVDWLDWREKEFVFDRFEHWEDDFVFLVVARLVPIKKVNGVITAFEQVVRQMPRCRLVIVGTGRQLPKLKRQVKDLGIAKEVEFITRTDSIVDYYRHSNCYISFSQFEGFGVPLVEALACQLPVITTPVGIAPMIVHDGVNGLFVPINDVETLAMLMKLVVRNGELLPSLKKKTREYLPLLMTEQDIVDKLHASWQSAIKHI